MEAEKNLVLIVEDDESIRRLHDIMFQREGYETGLAADRRETTFSRRTRSRGFQ